ncbi:cytochrome ubiquinol oxidase subunit I [Chitinilyticum piscinae]|uniref:Cytochrome ubiquinol oxidase subunit I n=1 Tax=Chitinilyticum piscinae TaxID=2866724 RepID=A0A8J7K1E5_9NEIS|nr:cytochrome ubiquinol oxidase subunit I [Chitinilyticum piscinae]MBE9608572.1 cytochrome ubiquinol oxidase subunit I [Chitinilyticum piscinae]
MDFDVLTLSRIQFGANITFHILFPTISIALGWVLLWFKTAYRRSGDTGWLDAYYFWVKVFALTFALGVVSGITMSFQFGTNWPGFMQTVGDIAGPLLAYEVLTAFFLEATFLGIMLFGRQKVGERMHTFATFLVAAGTTASAFWIIVLNSWMQTPAGFEMIHGRAVVTDWLAVIFNPSMPYRLSHMLLASALTVAFLVAGISAWRWGKGDQSAGVKAALKTALIIAAVLAPLQAFLGDLHGLNTLKHQPAKIAAIEGVWHTERGAPLQLFALPNGETRSNDYSIAIPKLASLILTHELNGEIRGLNEFGNDHPPVAKVFWSFRIMVGVGLAMMLVGILGAWQFCRRRVLPPLLARALVWMTFSGWIATVAGWYVAEIGRQPWLVQGVLRTADAVTKVPGGMVASTLLMYLLLYALLLAAYVSVVFHMAGKAITASTQGE